MLHAQVLAVTGRQATADGRELWLVQFYSQAGEHLRTMRVPGSGITGLAWEGSGLRLALSVESHIFFTSVRQAPLWGCFAGTIVYAFSKPDRPETCVMFWGTHSNECNTKYVKRVNHICAAGEFCLLVTKVCVVGRSRAASTLDAVRCLPLLGRCLPSHRLLSVAVMVGHVVVLVRC